eukprot:scpid80575/ scgid22586/ 
MAFVSTVDSVFVSQQRLCCGLSSTQRTRSMRAPASSTTCTARATHNSCKPARLICSLLAEMLPRKRHLYQKFNGFFYNKPRRQILWHKEAGCLGELQMEFCTSACSIHE